MKSDLFGLPLIINDGQEVQTAAKVFGSVLTKSKRDAIIPQMLFMQRYL